MTGMEYVVQWHDGDGGWIDDGGQTEDQAKSLEAAGTRIDECEYERLHYGYHFRIVARTTVAAEEIVETYDPLTARPPRARG